MRPRERERERAINTILFLTAIVCLVIAAELHGKASRDLILRYVSFSFSLTLLYRIAVHCLTKLFHSLRFIDSLWNESVLIPDAGRVPLRLYRIQSLVVINCSNRNNSPYDLYSNLCHRKWWKLDVDDYCQIHSRSCDVFYSAWFK